MTKKIEVCYVAMLKERVGRGEESVETEAGNLEALYGELSRRHELPWPASAMRPALNDRIVSWDTTIKDGDRVMFLPPPSGG